jgi:hypothetical protein
MVTIMIDISCDSNHRGTRESLIQVTSTTHSQGGELLPLHYEGDGVDGVEGATGSGSAAAPLLSS